MDFIHFMGIPVSLVVLVIWGMHREAMKAQAQHEADMASLREGVEFRERIALPMSRAMKAMPSVREFETALRSYSQGRSRANAAGQDFGNKGPQYIRAKGQPSSEDVG